MSWKEVIRHVAIVGLSTTLQNSIGIGCSTFKHIDNLPTADVPGRPLCPNSQAPQHVDPERLSKKN